MKRFAAFVICLFTAGAGHAAIVTATPENIGQQVQRLKAGDVLTLKAGIYRATVDLRGVTGTKDAPITIKSEASGRAILRGSDILKSWKRLPGQLYARSLSKEPSQVFINGDYQKQIGGTVFDGYPLNEKSEYHRLHAGDGGVWPGRVQPLPPERLPMGSFWYDVGERVLYVRTDKDLLDEATNIVEASQRERVFFAENVAYVVVENIDIQHANTSVTNRGGALVIWHGSHIVMRGLRASWNDLTGIQFAGDDILLEDSDSSYNGQLGVSGFGSRAVVQRVRAGYNNRRGFNKYWEAGGFKFIGFDDGALRSSVVQDCVSVFNQGDGIWFDWKNSDVDVLRNVSAYNTGFGIHYEASSRGRITDNVVFGNGQRGIYLSTSRFTKVSSNVVLGNGGEGIVAIKEKGRADNDGRLFQADGNQFEQNIVAWNAGGAVIVSSDEGAYSDKNVFYGQGTSTRYSVEFPSMVNPPLYGLDAWARATAQDRHSWWVHEPMPDAWKQYLAQRSLDAAPLKTLVRESRQRPRRASVVLGPGMDADDPIPPTPSAGPSALGH